MHQPMADLANSSTTSPEPRRAGKRGGDRRSKQARALQAAKQPSLVSEISERRQLLDQNFYDYLRRLLGLHGARAVDQALATWQQQRDAVAVAPSRTKDRGPRLFGKNL